MRPCLQKGRKDVGELREGQRQAPNPRLIGGWLDPPQLVLPGNPVIRSYSSWLWGHRFNRHRSGGQAAQISILRGPRTREPGIEPHPAGHQACCLSYEILANLWSAFILSISKTLSPTNTCFPKTTWVDLIFLSLNTASFGSLHFKFFIPQAQLAT